MKIGLIDIDGHNFPNLPLMKLSAWHKLQGDTVDWYEPLLSGHMDRVYISKVFSFTPDYEYYIDADEIIKGGSGYAISIVDGKEQYDKTIDSPLPKEIEHIYPDYSLYYEKIPEVKNTAYGYLTRGCPRGCNFCHVADKEGRCSVKVSDLYTFYKEQKNIVLLDPNISACRDWKDLFQQLIDSHAYIDFSQGLDIRIMSEEMAGKIAQMNIKNIHFAWDNYQDKNIIVPKFKKFKELTGFDYRKLTVYILTNFDTSIEEDLERIYTLRELGYSPFVMIYNKFEFIVKDKNGKPIKIRPFDELLKKYTMEEIQHFEKVWSLQRWVNNNIIFRSCDRFENFIPSK